MICCPCLQECELGRWQKDLSRTLSHSGVAKWFFEHGRNMQGLDSNYALASLVAQTVKNLPAIQETQVQSLGWEDPLEKGMATKSTIFAWRIPWTEEPGKLQSMSHRESDMTEQLTLCPINLAFGLLIPKTGL